MPNKNPFIFAFLYPDPGASSNSRQKILKKKGPYYRWEAVPKVKRTGKVTDYIGGDASLFK